MNMQCKQGLHSALDDIETKLSYAGLDFNAFPSLVKCREMIQAPNSVATNRLEANLDRAAKQLSQYPVSNTLWPSFAKFDTLLRRYAETDEGPFIKTHYF